MVQMPFIPFGDPPEDTVHIASFFRQDSGDAIDVYKRQVLAFAANAAYCFSLSIFTSHFLNEISRCGSAAVSYTHLDVYKRQVTLESSISLYSFR